MLCGGDLSSLWSILTRMKISLDVVDLNISFVYVRPVHEHDLTNIYIKLEEIDINS